MTKRIIALILMIFTVIVCSGCSACTYRYEGNHIDLYTVAVHNVFGADGFLKNGDLYDPSIEVIETDEYGRVMFFYHEQQNKFSIALLIMQKSENGFAYYYQDTCCVAYYTGNIITGEQDYRNLFTDDQVQVLKDINDWNRPLDLEKCTKTEFVDQKPDGTLGLTEDDYDKAIKSYAAKTGYRGDDSIFRYAGYCNTDKYGRELYYVYGVGRDVEGIGVSPESKTQYFELAMIFNPDKSCPEENIYEIDATTENINEALKLLKKRCGWNNPWVD